MLGLGCHQLMRLSFLSIGNVSQGQDNRAVANQLLAQAMWTPVSEGAVVMASRVVVASPVREAIRSNIRSSDVSAN